MYAGGNSSSEEEYYEYVPQNGQYESDEERPEVCCMIATVYGRYQSAGGTPPIAAAPKKATKAPPGEILTGLRVKLVTWDSPPVPRRRRNKKDVVFKGILGKGAVGQVYEAMHWNRPVAIKVLPDEAIMTEREFVEESKVLRSLDNPNIVKFLGMVSIPPPYRAISGIVMEHMPRGNLRKFLRTAEGRNLPEETLLLIAMDIAFGMEYLEARNVLHRDLAARNILLDENLDAKIGDFGLSRALHPGSIYQASVGGKFSRLWTAPEGIASDTFSTKSDVWSFGVVLFEIFSDGAYPQPQGVKSQRHAFLDWLLTGHRLYCPRKCPPDVYGIMRKCWNKSPRWRPRFRWIVNELGYILQNTH